MKDGQAEVCYRRSAIFDASIGCHRPPGVRDHEGEPAAPQQFLNFLPLRHGQ